MTKVWFITGSTRGLGRSLTEAVLAKGDQVAATARQPEQLKELAAKYPDQLFPGKMEVTSENQVNDAGGRSILLVRRLRLGGATSGVCVTGAAVSFKTRRGD